ncbi:MAG: hypothetical protein JWQ90_1589 [Hydrocarboniphaga sp.]|uniref:hypothetical protein n=1 Tax=Hydrocarboniphaga sp. TaxID=2033016 RepID=UPI00262EA55F|nr:hypothetical protein [Hydrocarboniphaga sp.]MDB5969139.1 hypothetical protein [Hydrocarboniphaga sp.]
MTEIYISTDVETDGPIPGPHSMLSIASAAYRADKTLLATFTANLETLPGALAYPPTAEWWLSQPEAWAASRTDLQSPAVAMPAYVAWLKSLPGTPVFVALPAGFDFMFAYWYLMRFAGESPFRQSALDIQSYVMGARGLSFVESGKHYMPRRWFDDLPHTHIALDDAIEQGALFCNILAEHRRRDDDDRSS